VKKKENGYISARGTASHNRARNISTGVSSFSFILYDIPKFGNRKTLFAGVRLFRRKL